MPKYVSSVCTIDAPPPPPFFLLPHSPEKKGGKNKTQNPSQVFARLGAIMHTFACLSHMVGIAKEGKVIPKGRPC